MDDQACANTDRELYREPDKTGNGNYYSDSIHVTQDGGIGINCGGYVIVMKLKDWHRVGERYLKSIETLHDTFSPNG